MPRIARVVVPGYPHHITQRGNHGQDVFIDDKDREIYLAWIDKYSCKYGLSLLEDCLMPNHVHFMGVPEKEDSLAKTFNAVQMRYAQYYNDKVRTKGHLWQSRFYSCVLDGDHLIAAARYIERNPVRAGLVSKPWQWKWSSASKHIGEKDTQNIKLKDIFEFIDIPPCEWRYFIDKEEENKDIEIIRRFTLTGRPLGKEEFVKQLERSSGRKLGALPIGRPKKR